MIARCGDYGLCVMFRMLERDAGRVCGLDEGEPRGEIDEIALRYMRTQLGDSLGKPLRERGDVVLME